MPVLKFIRKYLNLIKKYAFPNYQITPTVYDLYKSEQIKNCYEHFKNHLKNSVLLPSDKIREYAINLAKEKDNNETNYYIEFGVFSGSSINFLSKKINKKIYGFDSFRGLKEDWVGTSNVKGTFDLKGEIPKLENNVVPIKGWIQETLPKFLLEKNPKIIFLHIDVDTYETTKFILEKIKSHLLSGAIILFDELYNFEGWDVGEYKALSEVFNENEYKFVSFSTDTPQVIIEVLK